ncbi:MAG TPA: energy transducer TonB [Methylomirabilota bacterium]|nr:energy transducer TonB [Methylomirabilota bacterium]
MLNLLTRGRTLSVGVSCLVHVALIVGILSAERWIMSAEAFRPPVLITEVVTVSDVASSPEPIQKKPEAKRAPSTAARLARSLAAPLHKVAEAVTPAPPVATPPVSTPAAPEMPPPVASAAPGAGMTASREPVAAPGPPAGAAVSAPAAVASAPSRDTGTGGAITQSARPQGGYQVRPSYPSSALRQGIQGTTMLKVHVLIDGRVGDIVVQQSAGHPDLDQAAIEAVRRWRFEPARRGSDPVAMWVLLPVQFQIR